MTPSSASLRLGAYYAALFVAVGIHIPVWPLWLQSRGLSASEIGWVAAAGLGISFIGLGALLSTFVHADRTLQMVGGWTSSGQALAARVPEGPWHFPEDQVSDATDRMLAAEITREQLYLQLHAELPYASAVETEKYEERKDGSVAIHQQILVGRDTQRAIVLGKRGARLK